MVSWFNGKMPKTEVGLQSQVKFEGEVRPPSPSLPAESWRRPSKFGHNLGSVSSSAKEAPLYVIGSPPSPLSSFLSKSENPNQLLGLLSSCMIPLVTV